MGAVSTIFKRAMKGNYNTYTLMLFHLKFLIRITFQLSILFQQAHAFVKTVKIRAFFCSLQHHHNVIIFWMFLFISCLLIKKQYSVLRCFSVLLLNNVECK